MFRLLVVLCVLGLGVSSPALASCGLDHCPIVLPDSEQKKLGLRIQIRPHTLRLLKGFKGNYGELFLSAEYRG